jgi:M6 family metalloprotease-like protein
MGTQHKISYIFIALIFSISKLFSVPACPDPIKFRQVDGSEITIKVKGDEFFHYTTSEDGYVLVPDSTGILMYADQDTSGKLIPSKVRASNTSKRSAAERKFVQGLRRDMNLSRINMSRRAMRSAAAAPSNTSPQRAYPITGTPKSLVILVNFSDRSFVTPDPQTAFTNLLNQPGYAANGGTGSAKDYFNDNSMGVFNPQFDVVGPFTLPNPMLFYGKNDAQGQDIDPRQMVIDACTLAAANGVDFSQYDTDKNGMVDNVFVYYAGYNEAESGKTLPNTIWPHRWSLPTKTTKFNNVTVYDYACASELRSYFGSNMCGIGTFCHEFGHVLGLPDYYVTSGTDHHTLSYWNIMDSGPYLNSGRTPPAYSGFDRFFLNWLIPTEIKDGGDFSLEKITTSNKAYIFTQNGNHNLSGSNPTPNEFFTLENRQKQGWDAFLPGHGMLLTHIYYNTTSWNSNTPNNNALAMGVDIVEADGLASDSNLPGDPFPGTTNKTAFTPLLRDGTDIKKPLSNIQEINNIISFHFASQIVLADTLKNFQTIQGTPSNTQTVTVSGSNLLSNVEISLQNKLHYKIKKSTDLETAWRDTIVLRPLHAAIAKTAIQICYNPTTPSFKNNHLEKLTFTAGVTDYAERNLTGISTRPIFVIIPTASNASDTTSYGFITHWNPVFDASGYYLSVYNISNNASTITEGFDNGLTPPSINWKISTQSTNGTVNYYGLKTPAIQFSNDKEFIQTEKFILPANKLSFFIRSLLGANGALLVEAQNSNGTWEKVDSLAISLNLNANKSYTLPPAKGYNCFRFTYRKGTGSVTFDDLTLGFDKTLNYNLKEKWTIYTSDTIKNLIPNTEYSFKVKASDKNVDYGYENITDYSNSINVKTLPYPSTQSLVARVDVNGNIWVILPASDVNLSNSTLQVYNILGQCVKTIVPNGNPYTINDLPKQQIYILRLNGLTAKIKL